MDEKWKDYFYKGAAVFLTVAMCILFFFVVFRFDDLRKYIGIVIKILMPFIYGGVIAYLLSRCAVGLNGIWQIWQLWIKNRRRQQKNTGNFLKGFPFF